MKSPLHARGANHPHFKDISGQRFGDYVAVNYVEGGRWLTLCDCGTETILDGSQLRYRGKSVCGHPGGLAVRFYKQVQPEPNGCIRWTGFIQKHGYGRIGFGYKTVLAHRVAYEIKFGAIPPELVIDHLCRNRWCVNPEHLEPVVSLENFRRGAGTRDERAKRGKYGIGLSRFKGVSMTTDRKKWMACCDGRYLGVFAKEEDAARAYNTAAVEAFGPEAFQNLTGDGPHSEEVAT